MGKLNPKQVENLAEPGSLVDYRETSQEEVEMGRPFAGRHAKGR